MFLIVGLGNPGPRYAHNRHNVGFMAADAIARRHGFGPETRKFEGLLREGVLGGQKIFLFKPQTYMNLSGQAVGALARFYKIPLEAICVIHDELDLKLGKIRVKRGGSSGGHNGLKSMDEHLGADYLRLRIGIAHPGDKEMVTGHVLGDFSAEETKSLEPLLAAIAEHSVLLAEGDEVNFMNKVALAHKPVAAP